MTIDVNTVPNASLRNASYEVFDHAEQWQRNYGIGSVIGLNSVPFIKRFYRTVYVTVFTFKTIEQVIRDYEQELIDDYYAENPRTFFDYDFSDELSALEEERLAVCNQRAFWYTREDYLKDTSLLDNEEIMI